MRKIAIVSLALGALLLPSSQVQAAADAPAWRLSVTALPTVFPPGFHGSYLVVATNVGGAPTTGSVTLVGTMPAGVTPTDPPSCSSSGQDFSCAFPGPVYPGEQLQTQIEVQVDPLASGTSLAEARVEGGGAAPVSVSTPTTIGASPAPFDFIPGFGAPLSDADGAPSTQAGSHPHQLTVNLGWPTEGNTTQLHSAGHVRGVSVDLPQGQVVNPRATSVLCTEAQLTSEAGCPETSQIGIADVITVGGGPVSVADPIYNMVPPPGTASNFGFDAVGLGVYLHIVGSVRSNGDYGLTGTSENIPALPLNPAFGAQIQLWGDPSSPSHDEMRGKCLRTEAEDSCPVTPQSTALLSTAPDCSGQPKATVGHTDSWEEPGVFKEASYESSDLADTGTVSLIGCNRLEFSPTIEAKPTTDLADSPSGLDVLVHQPQNMAFDALSPAPLKDITLTLPEGMAVNPSSAEGLGVCEEAQANLASLLPSACPDAAKIGTVDVSTPLLDHSLPGALYLARPFHNPFGSLIAIYLAVHDSQTGVVANLPGRVQADPATGQLKTIFTGNPELPIEDIRAHLFTGPRAPLRTPPACTTYVTRADMIPWSAPETPDAHPSDTFAIGAAPNGGACPASASGAPHSPSLDAGTLAPQAGAFSPFILRVSRKDDTQPLVGVEATMPPGLSGRLAGVAQCPEAQIAQAKAREKPEEGALERANPSCPASSEVGVLEVAAGAGPTPIEVEGHAYLAGPYKGAPISLAIITPAVAGPFDLGAVVVRTALHVDPETAQIHAISDPLPQIIEGIPLDVRSIELRVARPNFTLNPTSCDPMAIGSRLTSVFGQSASPAAPFQVGGCKQLPFKPKLSLRLKGGTKRASHPKLIASLKAKPGEANIAAAQVKLPPSAFLDQAHIRTICTRVQFAADTCPKGSIYGTASATTPLLDQPLSGNVYLRSSSHKLPDLVVALKGPDSLPIEIDLAGKTDSVKGSLRNTFEAVPDAPVSKFTLQLFGGKRGLVVNSRNLCAHAYRAEVNLDGQNGKVFDTTPVVGSDCKGRGKRARKRSS